jgi:hypothetical protein
VRQVILLVLALAAGCSKGLGADYVPDPKESPGSVTLRLLLPSTRSFCDHLQCGSGAAHVTIANTYGEPILTSPGFCPTLCSAQCTTQLCPLICPIGSDVAVTSIEMTWDGTFYRSSTCGGGATSCLEKTFVHPGSYEAILCATPGSLSDGDAGMPTCTASGPEECVRVRFEIPGPTIEVPLSDAGT